MLSFLGLLSGLPLLVLGAPLLLTLRCHLLLLAVPLPTRVHLPWPLSRLPRRLLELLGLRSERGKRDKFQLSTATYYFRPLLHVPTLEAARAVLSPAKPPPSPGPSSGPSSAPSSAPSPTLPTGLQKGSAYDNFASFTGSSVFTCPDSSPASPRAGDSWRHKRHELLKHVFRSPNASASPLQPPLSAAIATSLASFDPPSPADLLPLYQALTFGISFLYLLGRPFAQPASLPPLRTYLCALTRIRVLVLEQSRSPLFLLPARLTPAGREIGRLMEVARPYARHVLETAPAASRIGSFILSCRASMSGDVTAYLLDEVTTLLFASVDTSAGTLSFATCHLAALPRAPVDVDAHVKETLRLTPVAEFVVRPLVEPLSLPASPAAAARVPAGVQACVWIKLVHTNPAYYARPQEFLPERWTTRPELVLEPGAFLPFGLGGRACVGSAIGRQVVREVFGHVAGKYVVGGRPDYRDVTRGFTTLPRSVRVTLTPRAAVAA
ncbi:hypothetical protein TeGR_g10758 [Tetraparma gracilis]|uniref:Cytochrome P450 n=1 Tax=Tetraparma gracilis TaxID=2962635 RepID=A0ABQ6MVH9_9STRA|nr:hypothetical protein TeGR_g10758 [Tetraparma gracilis]